MNDQPLEPAPGTVGINTKVQAISVTVETQRGTTDKLGAEPVGMVRSVRFGSYGKKLPYNSKTQAYRPQLYIHYISGTSGIFIQLAGLPENR